MQCLVLCETDRSIFQPIVDTSLHPLLHIHLNFPISHSNLLECLQVYKLTFMSPWANQWYIVVFLWGWFRPNPIESSSIFYLWFLQRYHCHGSSSSLESPPPSRTGMASPMSDSLIHALQLLFQVSPPLLQLQLCLLICLLSSVKVNVQPLTPIIFIISCQNIVYLAPIELLCLHFHLFLFIRLLAWRQAIIDEIYFGTCSTSFWEFRHWFQIGF